MAKDKKIEKKQLKEEEKAKQAAVKEAAGKKVSSKDRERIRLLRTKLIYKQDKEYSLRLKNVKRSFGPKDVLRGVTFDLKKGERLSLIGKNGSGKSTLINIISQQLKMSAGEIRYGYASNRLESLELMGIQFQTLNYPEGFIVKDVIHFFNVSVEKSIRMSKRELSDMISMFGVDKYMSQSIDRLSGGQQQRINILLALIKRPKLLILDEISTGLDVESAETIKGYIEQYLKRYPETALLLVSHSDEEIRELTTRAIVLEAGKIVEEFDSKELNPKKFLEITSREPQLTAKEQKEVEKESEKHLKQLRKAYKIRKGGPIRKLNRGIGSLFAKKLDNKKMDEGNILEFRKLSKTYGKTVGAVRDMSYNIKAGSRVAITGPNGSGKSTLVEILSQVKSADKPSKRFDNMLNLAHSDIERTLDKLEEERNIEIRLFKNKYRLERDIAYAEADEVVKSKQPSLKEARIKAEQMRDEADMVANLAKQELAVLINKLDKQLEEDKQDAFIAYVNKIAFIEEQIKKTKKDKHYRVRHAYVDNGEEVPDTETRDKKPQIAYSWTKTRRGVRDEVGVQFQYASFPVEMTVLDVILFFARINENFLPKEEMIEAVKVFKLEKLLKQRAYRLSGGERQRLNVLLAIMKTPKLLILDEISTGLDVDSILKIDDFIQSYLDKTGATLILISHNYHEVHSLTDKIIVMKYGELTEVVDTAGWKLSQTKEKMRDIYKGGGI